jgi:CspA family cold shock protein
MAKGKIKNLIKDRGYGFIEAEDGEEIFFHRTGVEGEEFESLQEGKAVEYETESSPKGPRAVNVKVIEQ